MSSLFGQRWSSLVGHWRSFLVGQRWSSLVNVVDNVLLMAFIKLYTKRRWYCYFKGALPGSGGRGGAKWDWSGSEASIVWLGKKNYKTEVKEPLHFIGADHIFGPVIQIQNDLGHMYFWSCGQSISLMLNYFNIMNRAMPGTPASVIIKIVHNFSLDAAFKAYIFVHQNKCYCCK